jgi:MFS family permease
VTGSSGQRSSGQGPAGKGPAGPGSWRSALRSGPLRVPAFRLLTAGQFLSNIGDYCYAVALPWLVLSNHGNAASLGIILACYGVPRAVLTTVGGTLADRIGPRTVMLTADAVRCALAVVFAVFAAAGVSSIAALAPVAALLGACAALFLPASYTIMPSLLDPAELESANAVYQGVLQIGSLIAPVIGGVIVAAAGPTTAFSVDAVSYLASACSLTLIGVAAGRRVKAASADAAAAATTESGWRLLLRARTLQVIFVVSLAGNFAITGTSEVALPTLAHDRFGADGYGAILACLAVGTLAGTVIVSRIRRFKVRPATLLSVAFMISAAAIAALPFLGGLPGAAAAMLVCGIAFGFDGVLSVTLLQQWAPEGMLGRVMGLIMLASGASFPVSVVVAGFLSRHYGPSAVFPIAGGLLALAILGGITQREFRDFGVTATDPEAPAATPEPVA